MLAVLTYTLLFPEQSQAVFAAVKDWVSKSFGWLYVGGCAFFILFALFLMLGPYGRIRLGKDDDRPAFSTGSWFAMLFSAGMGIGLVFFGVAEPMMHYSDPPAPMIGGTIEAREMAIPLTMLHWGVHAWAVYVVMGLAIAYFAYRKGLPLALRSCLHPLLGDRIHGFMGHTVDTVAVLGTIFGLATSLGLGAMQVSAGFHELLGTPHSVEFQVGLIVVITCCAIVSLVAGVDKGIRRLSELNLVLALLLLAFVLILGPTLAIFNTILESLGGYLTVIAERTFTVGGARAGAREWTQSWTVLYWGWWISWAPFVGMFVARISKGRTIREFVFGVLLVPTLVCLIWFSVFGGAALHFESQGAGIAEAVSTDSATAIYAMFAQLPLGKIASGLAAVVVSVFFITSSDSASFVVDMLTSGGHPNPAIWQRIFWASAEGACAAVLLYAGGETALSGLQAGVVSAGLPFCIVILAAAVGLIISLRKETVHLHKPASEDAK